MLKKYIMRKRVFVFIFFVVAAMHTGFSQAGKHGMTQAHRENKNGWIFVHLEGSPSDIGYQHGWLLADDIDTCIRALGYLLKHETKRNWGFYRNAARSFLWDKLDREYKDEINGIVQGLRAKNFNYDSLDLTAYNGLEELAYFMCQCWTIWPQRAVAITRRPETAVHLLLRAVIQRTEK
jgi:hypothetical protein